MLARPDERTLKAFAALRGSVDFGEVLAWLEHSLAELDRAKRVTMDGALLRIQQGGAQALAEFIDRAYGRQAGAIAKPTPARAGSGSEHR